MKLGDDYFLFPILLRKLPRWVRIINILPLGGVRSKTGREVIPMYSLLWMVGTKVLFKYFFCYKSTRLPPSCCANSPGGGESVLVAVFNSAPVGKWTRSGRRGYSGSFVILATYSRDCVIVSKRSLRDDPG